MLAAVAVAQEALTIQEALAELAVAALVVDKVPLLLEQITLAVVVAVAQDMQEVQVDLVDQELFFLNTLTQEQSQLVLV
jgi:hypothetical protein